MSLDYPHIRKQLQRIIHDYKDAEGYEFFNDVKRWCLWFDGCDVIQLNKDLQNMPLVRQRIENVKTQGF